MDKIKDLIIQLIIGFFIGIFIGIFVGTLIVINDNALLSLDYVSLPLKALLLVLAFVFSVFMHELGHLVMGLLSGYRFSSFRILFFHVQKDEHDKLKLHFHHVPNTLGQCLMIPPKNDNIPIFWYNFGGVLFNILTSILAFIIILLIKNPYIIFYLISFIAVSIFSGFVNWIPISGMFNDGINYRLLKKDPKTRKTFYHLLDLNERLTEGEMITEIDFSDIENLNLKGTDHLQLNILMYLLYHYQLNFESDKYLELLELIYPEIIKGNTFLHISLQVDYYFMKLLLGFDDAKEFKTKEVNKYLKGMLKDEKKLLISLVEDYYKTQTFNQKDYDLFIKTCKKSVIPGFNLAYIDYANTLLNLDI